MNARLKPIPVLRPIEVWPISRPVYVRADLLRHPADWIEANETLLRARWLQAEHVLGETAPEDDYRIFCVIEHERECAQHDAFKDTYRGP